MCVNATDEQCAIGTALEADRTLGGLCDWVEPEAPASVDLPIEGAAALKAAVTSSASATRSGSPFDGISAP